MSNKVCIRFAVKEDMPVIEQLAREIWPAAYKHSHTPEQLEYMLQLMYSQAALQQQLAGGHSFMLAQLDNKPVGFASYSLQDTPGVYKLHKLYVLTGIQGKGIGKSILDFVMQQLSALQATALRLNVNRQNKARLFYEKLGFSVIGEEDNDIGNGYFMNDYVMEKPVENIGH